jgi:hypothetical protein
LTTLQFTGGSGTSIIEGAVNEEAFEGHVGLASSRFTNLRITGYLGNRSDITAACQNGTVSLVNTPSSHILTFTPELQSFNMKFKSGVSDQITQGYRIMSAFSGTELEILQQRLSGSGYGANDGAELSFGFTGLIDDAISGSNKPVYITSFTGNQLSSPQYNWMGHSYHTGVVLLSKLQPVSGNLIHIETGRLLPNHGFPQYPSSGDSYTPVDFGGTYPALSFDNTLEMYMDILWSAQCGTALDCTEPA